MMKKIEKTSEIGGRKLVLSTGHIAGQASGAVMATYGETVVMATVVAAPLRSDPGYFPLSVEYQEKLYAGGRIKGSRWVKREGRPSDDEILTARLVDRSIRPLFLKGYKKDVQVILTVLSVDLENSPAIPAAIATSAAVAISDIPWNGPVGVTNVGMIDGKYVANPLDSQIADSKLDLTVASTKDAILMLETGSREVTEKELLGGIAHAQKESAKVIKLISVFTKEAGVKKEVFRQEKLSGVAQKEVEKLAKGKFDELVKNMATKESGYADYDEIKNAIIDELGEEDKSQVAKYVDTLFEQIVREMVLSGKRPDGRKLDQIRGLSADVGVLPRTHGSAIFNRGQTQAMTITTLGAPSLEQTIETAEGEETKRYIHHYSMPPYSVGETGRVGWPKRREIGHGALAEKALLPLIPSEEDFPYTIRVVTEILSSNGSTSMASVCGSTLSLMDAGVPIKSSVAGIAMGLIIKDSKKYKILTDIVGVEDGSGDMDLKIAGTKNGITAAQLDVKTLDLTIKIIKEVLEQAKKAREEILKVMKGTLDKPRKELSKHAPKIKQIRIPKEKIGELIGPGGKTIKRIIAETGTQVDVDDDGVVNVSGIDKDGVVKAVEQVELLIKEVEPGEIYKGIVKRIQPFGVFVEVLPGKEGLVYISDMSEEFVKDPADEVNEGDEVEVRVKEIDNLGRINLSMILDPQKEKKKVGRRRGGRNDYGKTYERRRERSNFRDRDRGRGRGRGFNRRPDRNRSTRGGGPHFPTSRLLDEAKKNFSR